MAMAKTIDISKLRTVKNFADDKGWSTSYVYRMLRDPRYPSAQAFQKTHTLIEIDGVKFIMIKK